MTRHDRRVTVTVQGIHWDMDQRLVNVNTGQVYNNIPEFGNVFVLGAMNDGTYHFRIETYTGVVINDRVIVKVKQPLLN
jgi:hypothetical protein